MPISLRFYSSLIKCSRQNYSSIRKTKPKIQLESEEVREPKPVHVLRNPYPWKTKEQFVDHLAANVIYNKDGLVAINKPFGVPLMKSGLTTGHNESLFSIDEVLIPLASKLNAEKLLPAKSVERFASGISLFTCQDEKVVDKIRQCYNTNKLRKIHTFKYLAVTIGEPKPSESKGTVGMGLFEHKDLTRKLPVIMKEYSKKKVAENLVQEYKVNYKSLSHGDGPCSLVEIDVSSVKNHFLRVYFAHLFSPILGDHIFGNRVQEIKGKRLAISPVQADYLSNFQKIPADILARLKVVESGSVPNCLHLSQITLANFASRNSNLVLKAEPPPGFQFICETFGLHLPNSNE